MSKTNKMISGDIVWDLLVVHSIMWESHIISFRQVGHTKTVPFWD